MDLKDKIRCALREQYGDFNTKLETDYELKIIDTLINGDLNERKVWLTYNQVLLELKNSLNDYIRVKELQYKLTERLEPNEVVINVIEPIKESSPELERLYYKIKNF